MSPIDFWHQPLQPIKLSFVPWFSVDCIEALDVLIAKRNNKTYIDNVQ